MPQLGRGNRPPTAKLPVWLLLLCRLAQLTWPGWLLLLLQVLLEVLLVLLLVLRQTLLLLQTACLPELVLLLILRMLLLHRK